MHIYFDRENISSDFFIKSIQKGYSTFIERPLLNNRSVSINVHDNPYDLNIHLSCFSAYHIDFVEIVQNYFSNNFKLSSQEVWPVVISIQELLSNAILWGSLDLSPTHSILYRLEQTQRLINDPELNSRAISIRISQHPKKLNFNVSVRQYLPIYLNYHKESYRGLSIIKKHGSNLGISKDHREITIDINPLNIL